MLGPDSKSALRTKLKIREWALVLYLDQIYPAAATTVIQLHDGEASVANCLTMGRSRR